MIDQMIDEKEVRAAAIQVKLSLFVDSRVKLDELLIEDAIRADGVVPTNEEIVFLVQGDEGGIIHSQIVAKFQHLNDLLQEQF
jgi:hypothetical protein